MPISTSLQDERIHVRAYHWCVSVEALCGAQGRSFLSASRVTRQSVSVPISTSLQVLQRTGSGVNTGTAGKPCQCCILNTHCMSCAEQAPLAAGFKPDAVYDVDLQAPLQTHPVLVLLEWLASKAPALTGRPRSRDSTRGLGHLQHQPIVCMKVAHVAGQACQCGIRTFHATQHSSNGVSVLHLSFSGKGTHLA